MGDFPGATCRNIWFQYDGAPVHFSTVCENTSIGYSLIFRLAEVDQSHGHHNPRPDSPGFLFVGTQEVHGVRDSRNIGH